MKNLILLSIVVLLLWLIMFSPWTAPYLNFWLMMSISAIILSGSSLYLQRKNLHEVYRFKPWHILAGIVFALVLYLVFMIGNFISTKLFPFAQVQINGIYDLRKQSIPLVIGILVFLIGPSEEIFWRGYFQHTVASRLGPVKGYLIAAPVYALVHIWAFNFMLFMAALVCGLFWGFIYMRYRSLWPCIISHAVWDLAIFVLVPVR